jgi:pectin methylesterase-like acyl-CoA thioesterase
MVGGVRRCGLGLAMAVAQLLAALVVVASGGAEMRQKLPAGSGNDDDHEAVLSRLSNVIDPSGSWPPRADAVMVKRCGGVAAPPPCYISIQAALNIAPAPQEAEEVEDKYVVHVLAGVYDETVNITRRNVMLIGDGVVATVITGNKSNATGIPMNITTVELSCMHTVNQNRTINLLLLLQMP